jgi:uncharacterized protein (DUF58 family)
MLPAELVAERSGQIALEVANHQPRIPAFAIVVEDFVASGGDGHAATGRAFALRIEPGARETRSYAFVPRQRGALAFSGARVSTRFPFGLFSKAMWVDLPQATLVYPALDPIDARGGRAGESRQAEHTGGSGGAAPEAASLRAYAPGDAFRRIHWRASLRRDALMIREPEQDRRREITVRLTTRGVLPGEAFERDVRRAASEVAAHLAAGERVALRTDGAAFLPGDGPHHRARLLATLAKVTPERAEPAA